MWRVLEVKFVFKSELEVDLKSVSKLQRCKLDGNGPGLDLVLVSGREPFRFTLSDFNVY
jgi:hypothetical protein